MHGQSAPASRAILAKSRCRAGSPLSYALVQHPPEQQRLIRPRRWNEATRATGHGHQGLGPPSAETTDTRPGTLIENTGRRRRSRHRCALPISWGSSRLRRHRALLLLAPPPAGTLAVPHDSRSPPVRVPLTGSPSRCKQAEATRRTSAGQPPTAGSSDLLPIQTISPLAERLLLLPSAKSPSCVSVTIRHPPTPLHFDNPPYPPRSRKIAWKSFKKRGYEEGTSHVVSLYIVIKTHFTKFQT